MEENNDWTPLGLLWLGMNYPLAKDTRELIELFVFKEPLCTYREIKKWKPEHEYKKIFSILYEQNFLIQKENIYILSKAGTALLSGLQSLEKEKLQLLKKEIRCYSCLIDKFNDMFCLYCAFAEMGY